MERGMRRWEGRKRRGKDAREEVYFSAQCQGLLCGMYAECGVPGVLVGQCFACVTY